MTAAVTLCLGETVRWRRARGKLSFRVGERRLTLHPSTRGAAAALRQLIAGGASAAQLNGIARGASGSAGSAEWRRHLRALEGACAVVYGVRHGAAPLLTVIPMQPGYLEQWAPSSPITRVVLSRFACLRRQGERWMLESPLALVRCEISDAVMALLARLARPSTARQLAFHSGVPLGICRQVLALLHAAGCVSPVTRGRAREDRDPDLVTWEFADLLIHAASRLGRHDRPVGATYPFRRSVPPLPALKRPRGGAVIPLDRLDLRRIEEDDPPFSRVLEDRRSNRTFGRPINVQQVSEFLFRTARVRKVERPTRERPFEVSRRPYPSGGACYPLEVYVAVARCVGLSAGLYHYDPRRHVLEPVRGAVRATRQLLSDARVWPEESGTPQVLLVLTARFGRVAWKYRSISYVTILKEVGVLFQTMYLVATAMGLRGCAIGCGNASLTANAIGAAFHEESSVGEFLLGGGGVDLRRRTVT